MQLSRTCLRGLTARRGCSSVASGQVATPSKLQLRRHAVVMAVPMVGFGFMDNLVMIQAGDMIDNSIGVAFGLATLTSAAYGQIVSDVTGTLTGGAVDALASRLGLARAELTSAQMQLRSVKVSGTIGAAVGVAIGCFLGMGALCLAAPAAARASSLPSARPRPQFAGPCHLGCFCCVDPPTAEPPPFAQTRPTTGRLVIIYGSRQGRAAEAAGRVANTLRNVD